MDNQHTSDGAARPNLMTRNEFIRRILHSGEVTQVAQHLALVIFLVAEGRNQIDMSVRDLETITGWSRTAIKEHLDELDIFMRITLGGGRAKTLFELQGVIEDALATAVVAGSRPPDRVASRPPDQIATQPPVASRPPLVPVVAGWRPSPALGGREVATSLAAAVAVSLAATPVAAASRPPEPVVSVSQPPEGRQTDTKPVASASRPSGDRLATPSAPIERERESNSSNTISLSTPTPREETDPIQLNGVAIYGPGFKIDYKAIDLAAGMIGMPKERARAIAEICARDWAASGEKPKSPMARVKNAIMSDFNQGQCQDVRLEKARGEGGKSKESAGDKIRRFAAEAEEQMKKGGRP